MHDNTKELSSVRTIIVCYPDGKKQFWLTEETFAQGEELRRNGQSWVVHSVSQPEETGGSPMVMLREAHA
jgi:hypothetical protein